MNIRRQACVLGALVLLAGPPVPAAGQIVPGGQWSYPACMAMARDQPALAVERAEIWAAGDGGAAAMHCAAVALIALGQAAEAARRLEALAAAMAPAAVGPRAQVLAQAGQAWLMADQAATAGRVFGQALSLTPDDVELLIDRGIAQATAGQYWDAVDDLNRAHDLAPGRADILVLRASAYRSLEATDLAGDDLARALGLDPDNPDGLLERGILRRLAGDAAGARADWTRILDTAPGSPAAQAARANLDKLGTGGD